MIESILSDIMEQFLHSLTELMMMGLVGLGIISTIIIVYLVVAAWILGREYQKAKSDEVPVS